MLGPPPTGGAVVFLGPRPRSEVETPTGSQKVVSGLIQQEDKNENRRLRVITTCNEH